jgi:tRNA U34 5-methylaminomethyl-2-thiouridine-forming methyltransferase MnmC
MELFLTGDGSHTLFVPEMNEHYHSTFGAITESMQVFISHGLGCFHGKGEITIFEAGFGTGLNALLTALNGHRQGMRISYYAVEKNPVEPEIIRKLNYPGLLENPENRALDLFRDMHEAPWEQMTVIDPWFQLKKIHCDLRGFIPGFTYDLLYFDAFAPDKQPDMWTRDIFHPLIQHLNPGGIITTYCVKGSVQRLLKDEGLSVEKLPGPPGKREVLRGTKKNLDKI